MPSRAALRSLASTILVSFGLASPAFADWTLGGFFGGAHTRPTSLTLTLPLDSTDLFLSPVRYRSESLQAPIYYGYRVGLFPGSGWLGIEGELIHLKVIADTTQNVETSGILRGEPIHDSIPLSSIVQSFSITHGANLILVNAVARRAVVVDHDAQPRLTVAMRFGAGASIPHAESTIEGRHVEGYEWGALSLQIAAGAEVRVTRFLSLDGEYKLTRSVQDVAVADGAAHTTLTTHHVVAGLTLHLGVRPRVP